jgi:hypothetical protein
MALYHYDCRFLSRDNTNGYVKVLKKCLIFCAADLGVPVNGFATIPIGGLMDRLSLITLDLSLYMFLLSSKEYLPPLFK